MRSTLSEFAGQRALLMAVLLSLLVHAIVYWSPLNMAISYSPAKSVQYDATLVPLSAVAVQPGVATQAPAPNIRPSLPPRRTRPKSQANFAAPENVIVAAAVESGPETTGDMDLPVSASAPPPSSLAETSPAAIATVPPAAEAAEPAAEPAVEPPPVRRAPVFAERIAIEYKIATAISDGVANFRWTRKGTDYEIESSIQATGFLVSAFTGMIYQQSRGVVGADGLRPQRFSIRRGEGEAETAEFQRDTNALAMKRNGETRTVPLARDMQDMQSFLFQLAYDAPQLANTGDKIDVLVTNARKVYRYQFRKMGTERLETRFGAVDTVRLLSEAANPEDQYEVWLAPRYFYLPIKLKYYLGRFQVEQLATRIGVSAETAPANGR